MAQTVPEALEAWTGLAKQTAEASRDELKTR